MLHALVAGLIALVTAGSPPQSLSLEAVMTRARPGLEKARLDAEIAELEAELGTTRGFLRESPKLSSLVGWRHQPGHGASGDFGVELEIPLTSRASRGERAALVGRLTAARELLDAAATRADRQLLVTAFVDLWGAQQQLALRLEDERMLAKFARLLREQIAAGAIAAFHAGLVEADARAAQGMRAEAEAEVAAAWVRLQSLTELPPLPLPSLERPTFARPTVSAKKGLEAEALLAAQEIADARSRWEQSRELSRTGVATSLAREGEENIVLVGWRLGLTGKVERAALAGRTLAEQARREAATRRQLAELAERRQRSRTLLDGLAAGTPAAGPGGDAFAAVWQAAELRVREGKDSPSEAMNIRRAILAAQQKALEIELERLDAEAELFYLDFDPENHS